MDILKIETLTQKFIADTLDEYSPYGMCYPICFPLHLHFENNGIETSIRRGICETRRHFWLKFGDIDQTIIDPTIGQFSFHNINFPFYIGKKTDHYEEDYVDWFDRTYEDWLQDFRDPKRVSGIDPKFDFSVYLKVNLKAAIFVNNEIDEMRMDISNSMKLKKYVYGTYEIFNLNHDKKEIEEISKLKGFDNFLSKALNAKLLFDLSKSESRLRQE